MPVSAVLRACEAASLRVSAAQLWVCEPRLASLSLSLLALIGVSRLPCCHPSVPPSVRGCIISDEAATHHAQSTERSRTHARTHARGQRSLFFRKASAVSIKRYQMATPFALLNGSPHQGVQY